MVMRKAIYWRELSWMLLLHILQTNVEAGLTKRPARIAREVYPEIEPENDANQAQVCVVGDVVYATDELVPAEQPCLKCRCQPPGVQCETIKCIKKSGCKAIHRPNKCCPDYQCECHHEGVTYANGERVKTPLGGNCKVCYCRGGEVQCAQVSCYIRTDCEGKTVSGQCCPKYDHCPPKEPLLGRPPPSSINSEVLELWPLTKLLQNSSEESTSPTLYETQDANKIENESVTVENAIKITRATQTDFTDDTVKQIEEPKITIQEIIPEIKEIPITPLKFEEPHIEPAKEVDTNNDLVVTDPEPDSSEISEVFQQPPPVLRIGDKLLFLKQGELVPEKDASTPTSVITIIGAEGLQRGFEDSVEFHEVPANLSNNSQHALFNNSNDLEPKTSESTHILSLVRHKKKPETTSTTTDATTTLLSSLTNEEDESTQLTTSTTLDQTDNTTKIQITETTSKSTYDTLLEENPAYPAIPEIMSPVGIEMSQHVDNNNTQKADTEKFAQNETTLEKIEESPLPTTTTNLPEATDDPTTLDTLDSNTTETPNTTPETSVEYIETNSTIDNRSVESMDETTEDSGENTTPKNAHASIISNENASVESSSETSDESVDMLKDASSTPLSEIDIVEIIHNKTGEEEKNVTMKDVEMININTTHAESDITLEKLKLPVKSIEKRESSSQTDDVFRELDDELNADNTQRNQTPEEEKEESDRIFQELLEETSTPKTVRKGDKNSEAIEKVTDAIAKLTLKGRKNSFDTNILGVISNFFSPRYDKKK